MKIIFSYFVIDKNTFEINNTNLNIRKKDTNGKNGE